jgi:hypothetical protein
MRALEFRSVVVCDDIRKEVTGKEILIGVYSGEIVLPSFPNWFPASLWIEVDTPEVGKYDVSLRIGLTNKPPLNIKFRIEVNRPGTSAIVIPGLQLQAEEECDLVIEVQDGEEWHLLRRKKVMRGEVTLPYAVPAIAAPPASG